MTVRNLHYSTSSYYLLGNLNAMHVYASSSPCYCVFLHFFRSVLVRNSAILSWDSHAKDLFFFLDHHCQSSLVSRLIEWVIAVIHKSSFCLPVTSLRSLYYNLVYPYLVYCTSVWVSTYPTNLNRIVLLQKKKNSNYFQDAIWCSHWS